MVPAGLDADRIPRHVAVVMDGNGRWAKQRGLRRTDGHTAGEEALFDTVEVLCDVTNPLCGPTGASAIYGPQKGGTRDSIAQLDAGLRHLASLVERQSGRKGLAETPGASTRMRDVSLWDHPLGWGLVLFLLSGDWLVRRWFA